MDTFSWANFPSKIAEDVPKLARQLPAKDDPWVEQPDDLNPGYDLTILERQVSMFPQDPQSYLHCGDALTAQSRDVENNRYEFMIKSLSDKIRETNPGFSIDDYLPTKPLKRTR